MRENKQLQKAAILEVLIQNPEGLSHSKITENLSFHIENKTLQRRLREMVLAKQITRKGERRTAKYSLNLKDLRTETEPDKDKKSGFFSKESQNALSFLDVPLYSRAKVSYNRFFLEDYVPNETFYVPQNLRDSLYKSGERAATAIAAGTYARHICQRLLIDLSYNSSRLEGNTYSELDTRRLLEEGISAEGKMHADTVMIINHKEAILFLIENAAEVELNLFTIFNLHHLLSQDLLSNPSSCGNIRTESVEIGKSTYKPLDNPHLLKECLELLLLKARKIKNPFEQSFFLLVHLSYLQAFEDVNKRTARLACNIPFIKQNLCPLSFTALPREDYLAALLMIYETNNIAPMLEVFSWAYLQSCEHYDALRISLGEIDTFRVHTRQQRKEVMGQVIRENLHGNAIEKHIEEYCHLHQINNSDKFTSMTLVDLRILHAGAIVGLGITKKQFELWWAAES